jgi:hypothetical protein
MINSIKACTAQIIPAIIKKPVVEETDLAKYNKTNTEKYAVKNKDFGYGSAVGYTIYNADGTPYQHGVSKSIARQYKRFDNNGKIIE